MNFLNRGQSCEITVHLYMVLQFRTLHCQPYALQPGCNKTPLLDAADIATLLREVTLTTRVCIMCAMIL